MTPEEKIAALVKHIKKEFPNGCDELPCFVCPLHEYNDAYGSIEHTICKMLLNQIKPLP